MRAARFGELDRGHADAAGPTVDEKPFASFQRAAFEHVVPNCEKRFRDSTRLDQRQRFRNGQYRPGLRDAVLRVTAAVDECHDGLADCKPACRVAHEGHVAGDFKSRDLAMSLGRWVDTHALHDVWAIDAASCYLDQNLAGPGHRHRHVMGWNQDLWSAIACNLNGGHRRGKVLHLGALAISYYFTRQTDRRQQVRQKHSEDHMDWDDAKLKPVIITGDNLATFSISELEQRIVEFEREISRTRQELTRKRAHEEAASKLFKS